MARECKCKKNYEEVCRYSSNGELVPEYTMVFFEKDTIYYFYNKGDYFFISDDKKWLKDINRYCDHIEGMSIDEFEEYFDYEKKYNTKDENTGDLIFRNNLRNYNKLIDKMVINDLFEDVLSKREKVQFKQSERIIGMGDIAYESDYTPSMVLELKKKRKHI